MRVASNSLQHMADFYHSELKGIYTKNEINAIFQQAIHHYLKWPLATINLKMAEKMNQSELVLVYDCCKAIKDFVPIQYIFGSTLFYGLELKVTNNVLIPRPETEELVDLIVKQNTGAKTILDIGTGSGCIPLALKSVLKTSSVSGCDISDPALQVARKNAELTNLDVQFFIADILTDKDFYSQCGGTFDVIISNPPYIVESEKESMHPNVLQHEPHLALFVKGIDPVIFYKKITDICITKLNPGGALYFELNPLTASLVLDYVNQSAVFQFAETLKDMSGNTRFLKAIKKES